MRGYGTRDVAELLGISEQKVRSFVRAGLVSPERDRRGQYRFRFQDIVLVRTAKELTDARIPARKVWSALRLLQSQLPNGQSLASVRITAEGDRIVVRDKDTSWDPSSGQLTFAFSVADLASQVAPLVRRTAAAAQGAGDASSDDWYEIGLDLEAVAAIVEAKEAYRRATELNPGNAEAHINLGRVLQEEGDLKEAEAHYRRALAAAPNDPTAAFNLGTALDDLGKREEAVSAYEKAIQLASDFADAHYNLAQLYEKQGNRTAATRHLARYKALTRR